MLVKLGLLRGDTVGLEVEGGSLRIVRLDNAYNKAIDAGRECFDRYSATLAELAT